jgi:hypothetical protein
MTQQNCPVCDTNNELNPGEMKPCRSCGFPLVDEFNNASFLPSLRHDIPGWSRRIWNELKEKDKKIECFEKELAQLKGNPASRTQEAQPDDLEIDKTKEEVDATKSENLWKQLKPHFTSYINQEIEKQQGALAQTFRNHLDKMRAEIEKDIEARFKEQNQIELPDQTQSDHDSSGSKTSSDTWSSIAPDGMDMKTNISSSNVTSSSEEPHSSDWDWLYDGNPADITRDIRLNIEEVRSQNSPPILIKEQQRGMYWIVKDKFSSSLYLVPKPKARFCSDSLGYVEKIFDCKNHNPLEQQDWKLEKPAVVNAFETTEEKWSIQEKGSLLFHARR